ncbi:glutathione S-transferase [Leptolyngbyaceae cyanobacterium CCMR0082]|uniref:Glutathione S-transferase n=1 Tax=Adonisia turfae CCMR0082 TaxID=2304604 RepID=A0A6M0SGC4_9CYAN|nr:glutathione S-transferase [Adonisia turfae CCMR0082]
MQYPDRIQLYSLGTPNGQKVAIALEEMALPYEAHRVDIMAGDQFTDEFVAINPNSKIPAIVDPNGPGGESISVFESGAILIYLAEKSGQYLPTDPAARSECLQWLFFQVGGVGPMFGQFGHFYKYAKEKIPYGINRYQTEVKRLLGVLETQLQGQDYLLKEGYTIADIATFPWVGALDWGYGAVEVFQLQQDFPNVMSWCERCRQRPAAARGLEVTKLT